jgi:hypothetical protein
VCATGVHACSTADLPYWLDEELWEIELDAPAAGGRRKLVAGRGRLLRRLDAWDEAAMAAFALACRESVERRAAANADVAPFLGDIDWTRPSTSAFVAARAAELDAGEAAYAAERARQAEWLAERLGL